MEIRLDPIRILIWSCGLVPRVERRMVNSYEFLPSSVIVASCIHSCPFWLSHQGLASQRRNLQATPRSMNIKPYKNWSTWLYTCLRRCSPNKYLFADIIFVGSRVEQGCDSCSDCSTGLPNKDQSFAMRAHTCRLLEVITHLWLQNVTNCVNASYAE